MTDATEREQRKQEFDERRYRYLKAVRAVLESPVDSLDLALAAYAAWYVEVGTNNREHFAVRFGMILADLRNGNELTWAKFLSLHVKFEEAAGFAEFKALSPFKGMIVTEIDESLGIYLGDADEFLCTIAHDVTVPRREFDMMPYRRAKVTVIDPAQIRKDPSV